MNLYLENRVALVTGGSRGIGRAVAMRLARAGARTAICARSQSSLDDALSEMRQISPNVLGIAADISRSSEVEACIRQIKDQWGGVDILINNAGVYQPAGLTETTPQMWDAQFDVNLKGAFLMTRAAVPDMIERKTGTIIFISSMVAVMSLPDHSCYAACKWGMDGFAGCIGQELVDHGIKVHVIRPGFTDTSIFDSIGGKPDFDVDWIDPDEIAGAVEFLLRLPRHAQIPELNYTTTAHRKTY
ncbi:MAG: SDR family oxidoreductase [Candidatus Omnitrophica bacterium]|nr:SDR family oxidoreductase [Candidatus Omnitrophota bacterium]